MFKKKMVPRILQIHLRRWLHDRKLPSVETTSNLPKETKKIGTKSEKKDDHMKINKLNNKLNHKLNNLTTTKD